MLEWIYDNSVYIVVGGVGLLAVALVISFLFKTAWGHWHTGRGRRYDRLKEWDEQYKHYK